MDITKITQLILTECDKNPEFLVQTDTRNTRIVIEDKTIWFNRERLSRGNEKLKDIWIFDTPSGSEEMGGICKNSHTCEKECYALQQQLQYKNVRMFRLINIYLFLKDKDYLLSLIETQLQHSKIKYKTFRIHSSGDFYDQTEIAFWNTFIHNHPEMNFYAYTKVDGMFNFNKIEDKQNFNLIPSLIEDKGIKYRNFGKLDYIKRIAKKIDGFLCPATMMETKKEINCNNGCTYCVKGKKPLFLIHGKGRNAKKEKKTLTKVA